MGKRHTGRKLAMQALYQADLRRKDDITAAIDYFKTDKRYLDETREWAQNLAKSVWEKREGLDKLISEYAIDWSIDRINPIDKSILRLAFYELTESALEPNVIVNEAVEIAKKYSTDESPKFLNGILGQYISAQGD